MLRKFLPFLAIVLLIIGLIFYGNNLITKTKFDYEKQIKELQVISDTKAKKIEEARTVEREQLAMNIRQLQRELESNKIAYEVALEVLQTKKKKELAILLEKEPSELADVVGSITGFKVLQPAK